jgi:cobalt-zinc-cadmium efflux system protein
MTPEKRLGLVLAINVTMILALLLVGLLAHSLGVLASGADYLGDALGTGLSLAALRLSQRQRGQQQLTSYAALVNASLLLLVTLEPGDGAFPSCSPRPARERGPW